MIFVDETECTCGNGNVYQPKNDKEKLDSLQTALDTLNAEVESLRSSVAGFEASMQNYSNAAKKYTDKSMVDVRNYIENDIASSINTEQVIAGNVSVDTLSAGTSVGAALIAGKDVVASENMVTPAIDAEEANISKAKITEATIDTLEARDFSVTNMSFENVTADNVNANDIDVSNIDATAIEASIIKVKKIVSDLITSDTTEYKHAEGVDNTHLFKLSVPFYDGITNIIEQNGDFNIVIISNSIVSYTQNNDKEYLRKIDFEKDSVDLYFANISDAFWYKVMHFGAGNPREVTAGIIARTGVKLNIAERHGTVIYGESAGANYVILDNLPEDGLTGYIYILRTGGSYVYDDDTEAFIPMSKDISIDDHVSIGTLDENLIYLATQYTADMSEMAFDGTFYEIPSFMKSEQVPEGAKLMYLEDNKLKFIGTLPPYSGLKYGRLESVEANKAWFEGLTWMEGYAPTAIEITTSWAIVSADIRNGQGVTVTYKGTEYPVARWDDLDDWSSDCYIDTPDGEINAYNYDPTLPGIKAYTEDVTATSLLAPSNRPLEVELSAFEYSTPAITVSNNIEERSVATQDVQAFVDYRQNAINELLDLRSAETAAAVAEIDVPETNINWNNVMNTVNPDLLPTDPDGNVLIATEDIDFSVLLS